MTELIAWRLFVQPERAARSILGDYDDNGASRLACAGAVAAVVAGAPLLGRFVTFTECSLCVTMQSGAFLIAVLVLALFFWGLQHVLKWAFAMAVLRAGRTSSTLDGDQRQWKAEYLYSHLAPVSAVSVALLLLPLPWAAGIGLVSVIWFVSVKGALQALLDLPAGLPHSYLLSMVWVPIQWIGYACSYRLAMYPVHHLMEYAASWYRV